MRTPKPLTRLFYGLALGAAIAATPACTTRIATHGNLPDPEKLADIVPGEISKDGVVEILGSPSSVGMFGDEVWYYISERKETTAFFAPELTDRKVVAVHFDSDGVVSAVDTLGIEDGRAVEPVDRETPTAGNEMTIIQQILGNLGRYNSSDK